MVTRPLAALVLATALTLTGCATFTPSTEGTTMTPEESLTEIDDLVAATTTAAGGEWDVTHQPAEECTLPDGSVGVRVPVVAESTGAADPKAVIDAVLGAWESQFGISDAVVVDTKLGDVDIVEATVPNREDSFGIRVRVSANAMTLDSNSGCVPGDAAQINSDRD